MMKTSVSRCWNVPGILLCLSIISPAQTPTPAETKGTAVGQVINAAITAALPGVGAIENIIAELFPPRNGTATPVNSTSTNVKLTPAAVTKAVSDATTQGSGQNASLVSGAQSQLTALQGVIGEISAANNLALLAQNAMNKMPSTLFLYIAGGPDTFKTQWTTEKTYLNSVMSFDATQLGKITDETVLTDWQTLKQNYTQWIADVDNYIIGQPSVTNLMLGQGIPSYNNLSTALQQLATIPGVELNQISAQLASVKVQAPPSATGGTPPPPPPPPPPATTGGPIGAFIRSSVGK